MFSELQFEAGAKVNGIRGTAMTRAVSAIAPFRILFFTTHCVECPGSSLSLLVPCCDNCEATFVCCGCVFPTSAFNSSSASPCCIDASDVIAAYFFRARFFIFVICCTPFCCARGACTLQEVLFVKRHASEASSSCWRSRCSSAPV